MKLSRFFFSLSVIFFVFFLAMAYEQNVPQRLAFSQMPQFASQEVRNGDTTDTYAKTPSGLIIPSIKVWLPVYPSKITNGNWETSRKGVSFLSSAAKPGETGNAIFYGHNWPNLLGNLAGVKPGDSIQIISVDGQTKTFIVSTVQEVSPKDISVLSQTTDKRITIYTCTGFFDSKRLVVVAHKA